MNTLNKILQVSIETFFHHGVKSVTMDEIAQKMGMSKKTLYQFVENKSDLVYKTLKHYFDTQKKFMSENFSEEVNAIDELFGVSEIVCMNIQKMHPSIIFDLQKYYQDAWKMFIGYKEKFVYNLILDNILKGRKQGIYRKDFDEAMIAKFYILRFEIFKDVNMLPLNEYQFAGMISEYRNYHLRGIVNEKGIKYLEKKIKK